MLLSTLQLSRFLPFPFPHSCSCSHSPPPSPAAPATSRPSELRKQAVSFRLSYTRNIEDCQASRQTRDRHSSDGSGSPRFACVSVSCRQSKKTSLDGIIEGRQVLRFSTVQPVVVNLLICPVWYETTTVSERYLGPRRLSASGCVPWNAGAGTALPSLRRRKLFTPTPRRPRLSLSFSLSLSLSYSPLYFHPIPSHPIIHTPHRLLTSSLHSTPSHTTTRLAQSLTPTLTLPGFRLHTPLPLSLLPQPNCQPVAKQRCTDAFTRERAKAS